MVDLPRWVHPGAAVASLSHMTSDTLAHKHEYQRWCCAAASQEPSGTLKACFIHTFGVLERTCSTANAASSALFSRGLFISSVIFLSCCFTDWKKISQLNQPELQNKYIQQQRDSAASRSATTEQLGLITADVLPVCFDNLAHWEPLPGYVLPHAPVGSLEKCKRKDQTLWPDLVLTHHWFCPTPAHYSSLKYCKVNPFRRSFLQPHTKDRMNVWEVHKWLTTACKDQVP